MSLLPVRTDRFPAHSGAAVSLWYIANRLGCPEVSEPWMVKQVRLLIAEQHFPDPLPFYVIATGKMKEGLHPRSRWVRAAVDAWFDGLIPPHLADAAAAVRASADAERLDANAAALTAA